MQCAQLSDGQTEPYVPQPRDVNLDWAGMLTGWHGGTVGLDSCMGGAAKPPPPRWGFSGLF